MDNCKIIKRALLSTLLLPFVALIPYEQLDFSRSVYYTTITTIVAAYVFLINFPVVIQMSHTRPLSFQDLEDPKYVNPAIRKRFQITFIIMLQVFGAIMITGMVNYYLYRYQQSSLSRFEILGVTGGFISLLSKIQRLAGNFLLSVLNQIKIKSPGYGPRTGSGFQTIIRKISESLSGIPDTPHIEKIELGPIIPETSHPKEVKIAQISRPSTPKHEGKENNLDIPITVAIPILEEMRSSSRSQSPISSKKSDSSMSSFVEVIDEKELRECSDPP